MENSKKENIFLLRYENMRPRSEGTYSFEYLRDTILKNEHNFYQSVEQLEGLNEADFLEKFNKLNPKYKATYLDHVQDRSEKKQPDEQFKKLYKEEMLDSLAAEKETPDDELYKKQFRQEVLDYLGVGQQKAKVEAEAAEKAVKKENEKAKAVNNQPQSTTPKDVKKERTKKIKRFEESHSFEHVYKLKKEVIHDLKLYPGLSYTAKQKLVALEKTLDTQKKEHEIPSRKEAHKKESLLNKFRKPEHEMAR